jgi:hypothetical protein
MIEVAVDLLSTSFLADIRIIPGSSMTDFYAEYWSQYLNKMVIYFAEPTAFKFFLEMLMGVC